MMKNNLLKIKTMKKYLIIGALGIASMVFGQNYPYGYENRDYGYSQSGYGDDDDFYDDDFYNYAYNNFPDDYYYEYPGDYYPTAYYQSYYNDYRNSIVGIDWDRLFMEFNLSDYQIRQIMMLNNRFSSFSSWNRYYRMNPDRWYYDRFYALERILGPRIFVVIQNRYYGGYSPVRYFQNYRRTYYQPRYVVVPKYRTVNVNTYRIGRDRYFQSRGSYNGWNSRNDSNYGFKNSGSVFDQNGSRNGFPQNNSAGWRHQDEKSNSTDRYGWGNAGKESRTMENTNGWRSSSRDSGRQQPEVKRETAPSSQGGWRGVSGGSTQRESNNTSSGSSDAGFRTGGFR